MWCGRVLFADYPDDLGQFLHQVLAVLQPARGVDHQQIRALGLGPDHGVEGQAGGVGTFGRRHHLHTRTSAPDLQLLDGCGAERVPGGNHHVFARRLELAGKLADGRGLARAVYTDDQHHLRALGIKRQGFGDRGHDAGDLVSQQFFQFGG